MNEDETCVELLTLQLFPPVKINLLLCIFSGLSRWIWASWYRLESSLSIGTTIFVDNRIDSWTALTAVPGYPLSLHVSVNNGAEYPSKSWGKKTKSRKCDCVPDEVQITGNNQCRSIPHLLGSTRETWAFLQISLLIESDIDRSFDGFGSKSCQCN